MALLWIGLGFAAFGALVGTTVGLSSAAVTMTLLGLLFALIGGSFGVFLGKLDTEGKQFAGVGLLTFSVCAILGIYGGIYVRINDLLRITPPDQAEMNGPTTEITTVSDYLKGLDVSLVDFVKLEVCSGRMTVPEACALFDEEREVLIAE